MMPTLKIISTIVCLLIASLTNAEAKRHTHGGSCDGVHRCRCGHTQANYFNLPRIYHGFNLWLASEWPRAFPRTTAHPGAVGYQPGHVFRYVGEGSRAGYAVVSDDAGTYERRIAGAIFVDPNGNTAEFSATPVKRERHVRATTDSQFTRWNAL